MISMKKKFQLGAVVLIFAMICALFSTSVFAEKNTEKSKNANGTTYYISNSTGNDSNNGLSENSAWKTFSKLADLKLQGGDSVLLKCGDRWVGEYFVINEPTGTSEDNMVTISSYGKGKKPQIALYDKEVKPYSGTPLIKLINAEYTKIDGLDIGFCGVGINLNYQLVSNKKCIKILNCDFHDIYGFHQLDTGGITEFPHALCIAVSGAAKIPGDTDPALRGLYIDKCTTYDANSLFSYASRKNATGFPVYGLYVTNCKMENNGLYGIAICNVRYGYMDNCKIINNGSRMAPHGSMGIMQTSKDFTVMNCEICYQQRHGTNPDGGGIDFEHNAYDIDYINNYIHDNSGLGVMFYTSGGGAEEANGRIRFLYNVFENNNQNVYNPGGAELASVPAFALTSGTIANNYYMKSRNMFTMYISNTVNTLNNTEYPIKDKGKVWPLLDFDVVRDYVINGTPIPDNAVKYGQKSFFEENMYYILGAVGVLTVTALAVLIFSVIRKIKRRRAK